MGVRHIVLNSMGNKVMRVRGSWIKVRRTGGKLQMWAHSSETDSTEALGPEREHGDQVVKGTTKEPMASAIFFCHYYSIQNSW